MYGKEGLRSSFALGGCGHLADHSEREIARIAKRVLALNDLGELERLSRALSLIESNGISSMRDLGRLASENQARKSWTDPDEREAVELVAFIGRSGILPEEAARPVHRVPASKRDADARNGAHSQSSSGRKRQRETPSRSRQQPNPSRKDQQR